MIHRTQGNLLEADVEALVNTVNTVGVMGKGIALQFKKAFPENFKAYQKACDAGDVEVGRMFVHDLEKLQNPRFVINFPTKKHWRSKSKLAWITDGLAALVATLKELEVTSVALPPLGCGNGGLAWNDVLPAIEAAFTDEPTIKVFVYEPKGAPAAAKMVNRTKRPKMTIGRAVVLGLMDRYLVPGFDYRLSLLEVQKLVYFQVVAGETMPGLEYAKGVYGPYADTLRHVLNRVEGHFITGYGDAQNKPDTPIEPLDDALTEAITYLESEKHAATRQRFDRVIRLIEGFETPYGMELLSSVHWVITREGIDPSSPKAVAKAVHDWNERKANYLKPEHINVARQTLHDRGWI